MDLACGKVLLKKVVSFMNNSMKENVTFYILKPILRNLFISNWATFYRFISSKGSGGEKNPPMDMLFNLPPLFSPPSGDYGELSLEAF